MIASTSITNAESANHSARPPSRGWIVVCGLIGALLLGWFVMESSQKELTSNDQHDQLAMSDKDAKYLQDAEHLGGFVFGDLTLPKVAKALKQDDAASLRKFLHPNFTARQSSFDDGEEHEFEFATFRRWSEEDLSTECNSEEFVDSLLTLRREFSALTSCKFKVMQMSPAVHGELEGPWIGTVKLILAGEGVAGGIKRYVVKYRMSLTEITDRTPQQNEWLLTADAFSAVYSASDRFLMSDMTERTGIHASELLDTWNLPAKDNRPFLTGGQYACDYNRDGRVDLLLTDKSGLRFYEGRPKGKFVDVTAKVGLPRTTSLGAAFADFDGDSYEDLIVSKRLFRNVEGRRFVEVLPEDHTLRLHRRSSHYSIVDYDCDGRMDVYVLGLQSDHVSAHRWIGRSDMAYNQLWRNMGNWQFENVTAKSGTKGGGSPTLGAAWFDANGDNYPDVMTACELGKNDYFINQQDGTFKRGELPDGYGGFSMGIAVSDINNDGAGDPYIANMYSKAGQRIVGNLKKGIYNDEIDAQMRDFVGGNELYRNCGDGTFDRLGEVAGIADVGWTYGVGYVDLNGDGLDDMYSPAGFQSVTHEKPDG